VKIIETDTNDAGQQTFPLEKSNATGTLITAIRLGPAKFQFTYTLTGKPISATDTAAAWRAINQRIAS
jgi:hypothetical protein